MIALPQFKTLPKNASTEEYLEAFGGPKMRPAFEAYT
jgi:hypothetical protein